MPDAEVPQAGRTTVAVVGAGISGLAAAWELVTRRPDLRVLVLEGSPAVGGKLALTEVGGHTVDAGAEALLARRPEAVDLARAVGLTEDLQVPRTTSAALWTRGRLAPMPSGTLMGIPAHGADAAGVLTAEEAAVVDEEPDRPAPPLDQDVDVASYVRSRVGPAVVDRLVEPLLGGVYAGHASRLSLQATVPAAWEAARSGRSIVSAARALAARAGTEQARAAQTRPRPGPVFTGIRGGVGRLPLAAAQALSRRGVEVRTGVRVRGLRRVDGPGGRWRLVTGSRADERLVDVDAVVLAVPATAVGPPARRDRSHGVGAAGRDRDGQHGARDRRAAGGGAAAGGRAVRVPRPSGRGTRGEGRDVLQREMALAGRAGRS